MSASPRGRILVVDDNEWNVKLLQTLLARSGHDVAGVSEARQVEELALRFRPRLILMDLELPDVDGLTLARQLKGGADTRDIRIVIVTAHAAADVEAAVRDAGCDGLLTKPVEFAVLTETVGRLMAPGAASAPLDQR